VDEIGALYRGENMQISTYLEKASTHELSANVIDLCPVGALTSRPYAFEARPWELKKTLGIDVSDAAAPISASMRVAVLRFLPRNNDDVNEEWLSDKGRYQADGLTSAALIAPGSVATASWSRPAGKKLPPWPASIRARRSPRLPVIWSMSKRCLPPRSCWPNWARIFWKSDRLAYAATIWLR
jgi:hypothetical protein